MVDVKTTAFEFSHLPARRFAQRKATLGIEVRPDLADFSPRPIAEEIRGVRNGKSIIFPNRTPVLVNGHQLIFVLASELSSRTKKKLLVERRSVGFLTGRQKFRSDASCTFERTSARIWDLSERKKTFFSSFDEKKRFFT